MQNAIGGPSAGQRRVPDLAGKSDAGFQGLFAGRQKYPATIQREIEIESALTAQSGNASGQLLATSYKGRLSEQARSQLLLVVAEQYRRTQYMGRIAGQIMGLARDLGYQPDDAVVTDYIVNRNFASNTIGFCKKQGYPMIDWKAAEAKVPPISKRAI